MKIRNIALLLGVLSGLTLFVGEMAYSLGKFVAYYNESMKHLGGIY